MARHAMTFPTLMPFHTAPHDALGAGGRRWLSAGVLLAHLAGAWALLQMDTVRQAVAQAAPALMVQLIALADPPRLAALPQPSPSTAPRLPPPLTPPSALPMVDSPTAAPVPPSVTAPVYEPAPPAPVLVTPAVSPAVPMPVPQPAQAHAQTPAQTPTQTHAAPTAKIIPGSALRYLSLPRLNFPLLSRRANESGEVVLRIVVDANGQLKAAWVHKSSGFARIDQAALQDIRSARFLPHLEDGKALEVESLAVLAYDLDR
jgi:periplasmic protein TonB